MILTAGEIIQKLIEMIGDHGDTPTNVYMITYDKEDNEIRFITDVAEILRGES